MNNKITMIKNICKIVLSLIIIISMFKSCAHAFDSIEEMEEDIKQVMRFVPNGALKNQITYCMNSQAYRDNKEDINYIHDSMIIRIYRSSSVIRYVDFICFTNDVMFSFASSTNIRTQEQFTASRTRFDIGNASSSIPQYKGTTTETYGTSFNFLASATDEYGSSIFLIRNTLLNPNNYTYYGLNYTCGVYVPNIVTYVNPGEYYKLGERNNGKLYIRKHTKR